MGLHKSQSYPCCPQTMKHQPDPTHSIFNISILFGLAILSWCLSTAFANKNIVCFAAVKFGRMSKKQREKVEDEVRYHRAAQQRAQQVEIPDTTISSYNEGHQTPSSTDPHIFPAGYVSDLSPLTQCSPAQTNLSQYFVTLF